MNRDEKNNLYKEPSIVAFYQVSVHLVKVVSEEKIFRIPPIKNKELPVAAMFVNRSEVNEQSL